MSLLTWHTHKINNWKCIDIWLGKRGLRIKYFNGYEGFDVQFELLRRIGDSV